MYERIIEIMVILLTEMSDHRELSDIDFEKLNSLGFSNEEITTAFSWLIEKIDELKLNVRKKSVKTDSGFRILNKVEKNLFSKDAWGEIISLQTLGLLTNEHLEGLIDWAVFVGIEEVNKAHLFNYLAFNLFNLHSQQTNGSRYLLFGNDTVN
jgi:uncharacterized protein Smg (DUF494 family)